MTMNMGNGYYGVETSAPISNNMGNRSPHMQIRQQRSQKFNLYPTRPRTSSKASELSVNTARSGNGTYPFPPKSPTPSVREHYLPVHPLAQNPPIPYQRPSTSHHTVSNEPSRSFTAPTQHNLRRKPSEASRLRQLSNVRSHSSTGRRTPDKLVDNFSRPRQASLRRRNESPSPLIHASQFGAEPQDEQTFNNGSIFSTRDRGLSSASSQSGQQFPTPAPTPTLRPSASIPDYHTGDLNNARQRNIPQSNFRPRTGINRPDSNNSSIYRREPPIRPPNFDDEEVRASFRSALTTNSSYFGTSGTERSSVLTKSSSHTSFFGGKDEGMSVDDAIGMYEGGFMDSGVEDNDLEDKLYEAGADIRPRSVYRGEAFDEDDEFRPMTPSSERRQSKIDEAMDDSLAPPPALESSQFSIRGSTEMFHVKAFEAESVAGIPNYASEDFPESKEFDGAVASHEGEDELPEQHSVAPPPPPSVNPSDPARDRYGFKKKTQYVSLEEYEAWSGPYNEYVERRQKKWVALLKDHSLITDKPIRFPPKSNKVKRFVRKGIPPDWRGEAWFWYAGGPAMVSKHYGVYDSLVKQAAAGGVNETDDEIIERDLNRTFPDNIKFKPDPPPASEKRNSQPSIKEPETPMLKSLRRVLQAFSIYNPRIGYCQSLNFLAGLLLLFMDEEKSFWMLNIITRVYLPGTHEVNLEGANVDLGVLMTSIKESMPAIWAKIGGELDGTAGDGRLSMRLPPITLCTTAWFMSCFIGTLPIETTLRVWDSFFFEGSKTLFRIALAIFKVGEQEIRAVSDPMEIFQVVQTIPRRLVDANGLMDACFRRRNGFGHISQETIEQRRAERRKGYAEERAIANGETPPKRGGTFFSKKKIRSAET
ncbi:fc0f66ac-a951-4232-9d9f-bcaa81067227-CDS [Sclerotinia trifoliorum]|uniref:Fc0f66ac-a951-4232-9d9f-bcaa81067227-CDS n=1 Tax=Sclerotinia trifoliorum TaxID=28548 RepID=A0A8H2VYE5_9HELO|nr:fc0f66ac-a951-4232-9d9f-bcaa81067227-CDS [Sclerotinia trifoliorum]